MGKQTKITNFKKRPKNTKTTKFKKNKSRKLIVKTINFQIKFVFFPFYVIFKVAVLLIAA